MISLTGLIVLILAAGAAAAVVWALSENKLPSWAVVFLTLLVFGLVGALLPALVGG